MEKQAEIDLVKLEVLGCISENEIENLRIMEETDEDFPWDELAHYQNLVSLLPSILAAEIPSPSIKDIMIKKLNRTIFGSDADDELEIVEIKEEKSAQESKGKSIIQDDAGWESLSISDSLKLDVSSFQEVKTKKSIDRDEYIKSDQIIEDLDKEDILETSFYKPKVIPDKISSPSRNLRKYVFAMIIFIAATVSVLTYFLISETDKVTEFKSEIFSLADKTPALLELVNADRVIPFVISEDANNLNKEEIKADEKINVSVNKQKTLLTAPPTLPEPIDAPLVEVTKNLPTEDPKIKDEISMPPPKEIIEIKEEPTYFVAVEEMPVPVGGLKEIQSRIEYPEIAKRVGIEGKVFVRAFVDENGNVASAEVVKGIGGGCDEAALDAVLKTKFTPGKQRGKPIKVQVTVPIHFRL
jgi:protein TonB